MATLNEEKYRNAILYFAQHARYVGRTKLWKLLYYLDFDHYELYLASVTGEQYLRWENGPVPSGGLKMLNRMEAAGEIAVVSEATRQGNAIFKVYAVHPCDRTVFADSEWQMLQTVARKWRHHTAREMVAAAHGEPPWQQTKPNDVIDYALALERDRDVSSDEFSDAELGDNPMNTSTETALARARSLAYAERIERLWDNDSAVRAEIERGIEQMKAGEFVSVSIDALLRKRREKRRPS